MPSGDVVVRGELDYRPPNFIELLLGALLGKASQVDHMFPFYRGGGVYLALFYFKCRGYITYVTIP